MAVSHMTRFLMAALVAVLSTSNTLADAPSNFAAAKVLAKQKIFFDQASSAEGELYCGCKWTWTWTGKSGGRIDPKSCGYETRAQQNRAACIEWEHIKCATCNMIR